MAEDTAKKEVSTSTLLGEIFKASELSSFLADQEAAMLLPTLPEYLNALLFQKGMLRAEVIKRAEIDRSFGFQIFQGTKNPSRDKVLQIAIGFGLSYEETQELLRIAHKSALYPRIRRDAALIYCLNKRMGLTDTQAMLAGLGAALLGGEAEAQ